MEKANAPLTVDAYIASKPLDVQLVLQTVRTLIRAVIPDAQELIAWGMPSYKGHAYIIHFAAYKAHLGLYPGPEAIEQFKDRLKDCHTSKGAIQFPYTQVLPEDLIADIVRFCAARDTAPKG